MPNTVSTAIRVEEDLAMKLKDVADKLGMSTDALIRVILEDYLKDQDLKYTTSGKGRNGS